MNLILDNRIVAGLVAGPATLYIRHKSKQRRSRGKMVLDFRLEKFNVVSAKTIDGMHILSISANTADIPLAIPPTDEEELLIDIRMTSVQFGALVDSVDAAMMSKADEFVGEVITIPKGE